MNSKQFAIIIGITFCVGMLWLVTDIIFNTKASIPISPKLQTSLEPVNPNFNTRVLDIIDKETLDAGSVTIDTPVPEPSPSPVITPIPSAESTSSGELNR